MLSPGGAAVVQDDGLPEYPLLEQWILVVYLTTVCGLGLLLNGVVLMGLLRRNRSGEQSIILQIALSDIMALATSAWSETWARNSGSWFLGSEACALYLGGDVLTAGVGVYLSIAFVLHALCTAGLSDAAASLNRREITETRSSRHSLVPRSNSSTPPRTMNLDYRIRNTTIPVIIPIVFVWILAASLSVPVFSLATNIDLKARATLCTYIDSEHNIDMQTLLSIFLFAIPFILFVLVFFILLFKLWSRSSKAGSVDPTGDALKLSIWICVIYFVMVSPRGALGAVHALGTRAHPVAVRLRSPMLHDERADPVVGLLFSGLSFTSCLVRPMIYFIFLPEFRRIVLNWRKVTVRGSSEVMI